MVLELDDASKMSTSGAQVMPVKFSRKGPCALPRGAIDGTRPPGVDGHSAMSILVQTVGVSIGVQCRIPVVTRARETEKKSSSSYR